MTTPSNDHDFSWYLPLILDFACLLALGAFLLSVIRFGNTTYGFLMIIVLTLSYVGYPVINIYTFFYSKDQGEQSPILGSVAVAISTFNLYWTAAFAYFTYRVSKFLTPKFLALESLIERSRYTNSDSDSDSESNLNLKKISSFLTLACILPTLLFPFLIYLDVWGNHVHFKLHGFKTIGCYVDDESSFIQKISFIFARDVMGRLIPTVATPIYYFKFYNLPQDSRDTKGLSRKALLWLSIASTIPFFCAIPGILVDINDQFKSMYSDSPVSNAVVILRYFWEFLNLWAYWREKSPRKLTSPLRALSRSVSRTSNASRL